MSNSNKIVIIGAGSAQFSINLIKDICLTETLHDCRITLMDIDSERLDTVFKLAIGYSEQLGSPVSFEKTTNRSTALRDATFVINTAFVLGHQAEAHLRTRASERHGYYYYSGHFGNYHQLSLMMDIAKDMQEICPNAWLIQLGNPVFEGCTLITRETNIKICGLCHGYQGYQEIAVAVGLHPDQVNWQASGLNHNIWLTHFSHEGKNAYPLIEDWINTKSEEYWQSHKIQRAHDIQLSRGAVHQYQLYGLFPIGDTVRSGGWWYQADLTTQRYWFGEPLGGPDNHLARADFVTGLEKRSHDLREWANNPKAHLITLIGQEKSHDQTIPILDALINNREGCFQVNIPNRGSIIQGIPEDIVVEVQATINQQGIHPIQVDKLPPKIMFERILPEWIDMERSLLAFNSSDKNVLLYNILNHRQTRSYDQAVAVLDDLTKMDEIVEIENRQKSAHIRSFYKL